MTDNKIEGILKFPLVPKGIWDFVHNNLPNKKARETKHIIENFEFLDQEIKNGSIPIELIFLDFKYFINHPEVSKRKTTATTIEERLSHLFGGNLTDKKSRKNPRISDLLNHSEVNLLPKSVQDTICSNFREKGDILFNNNYKISVKSLMPNNKEINFGAFQYNTLFEGILDKNLLGIGERRNTIIKEIDKKKVKVGRGSRSQLENLFNYIKSIEKWNKFIERWKICFRGVFQEDIIIYLKDPEKLELHLIDNNTFVNLVSESLNYESNEQILNRWEGNSIRMDRTKIINSSIYSLKFNFSNLKCEKSFLNKMIELDIEKSNSLFSEKG
jgi:hypothetical protein